LQHGSLDGWDDTPVNAMLVASEVRVAGILQTGMWNPVLFPGWRIAAALLAMVTATVTCGRTTADVTAPKEASVAKQQDPTEEVTAVMADLQPAWQEQDVGKIMAAYSDDYSAAPGSKSDLRAFFDGLGAQGALQNTTVGMEECEFSVDGDSATAGPVVYESPTSRTLYQYKLKKEVDGVWRIVNSEQVYDKALVPTDSETIWNLEPVFMDKGPIKIIGAEDLFAPHPSENGLLGADGKTLTPQLYSEMGKVPNPIDPGVTLGIQRPGPKSDQSYHMAAYEVDDFVDIPYGLVAKVIPPSRYAIFSCEAPKNPGTGKPLKGADWSGLWPKVFNPGAIGLPGVPAIEELDAKDKGWCIEVSHYSQDLMGRGAGPLHQIARYEIWIAVEEEATISTDRINGTLRFVPGVGAAFQPLEHVDFAGQSIYRDGGLNFEHVLNGRAADNRAGNRINWFTPRTDAHQIVSESGASATVLHEADKSSWGIESRMTYTASGSDGIDVEFRVRLTEDRFPLGYVGFMWASYMNRARERRIHFHGELEGQEGWVSFGDDAADGFETGTVAAVGVPALQYEPGAATLNVVEDKRKRFVHPFYYGLVDGDGDLATVDDTMAYVMMFDQCEPIRFAMWNFVEDDTGEPDPHSPAWDWQYVIRNPALGQWYGYRARMEYIRFIGREDIMNRYEEWRASL